MNWKLIFLLSFFGLAMGVGTLWLSSGIEPIFWLAIFIFCAYTIAKKAPGNYFLHGFCVSLFNCVWIMAAHYIFYDIYIANHQKELEMMAKVSTVVSPRTMMLAVGPVAGILFGLILGLFCFAASKMVRKG